MDRGIRVTGSGTATGPRDECVVTVGAEVRRPTAAAAMAGSGQSLAAMREAFLAAGIPATALATSGVSLSPVHDPYPTVVGFQAAVQLTGRTRDVDAAGELLSTVVTAGGEAARVHDVAFRHGDPSALLSRARDAAWADAETRAAQLAGLAGRELGEVLAIEEVVESHRPPRPMRMAMSAEMASDARMTLDAGEGAVVVTLDVSWSLR